MICVIGVVAIVVLSVFGRGILALWARQMAARQMNEWAIGAARQWLAHRSVTARIESREQQAGLDLRTGNGRVVVDAVKARAAIGRRSFFIELPFCFGDRGARPLVH